MNTRLCNGIGHLTLCEKETYGEFCKIKEGSIYGFKNKFEYIEQVYYVINTAKHYGMSPVFKDIELGDNGKHNVLFPKEMIGKSTFLISKEFSSFLDYYIVEMENALKEKKELQLSGIVENTENVSKKVFKLTVVK